MGINLPQLAPASEDRVSGAQFIDGSLKFGASTNASGPYLSRTACAGNRKTWTLSCWIKRNKISASPDQRIFTARAGDGSGTQAFLKFQSSDVIQYIDSANSASIATIAKFRDTGWYHLTAVLDASNTTFSIYINGQQQTLSGTQPSNADGSINNNILHAISYDHYSGGTGEHTDTLMSQFYLIDGQALGPENFGYTDPLTGVWRPKQYTGDYNVAPQVGYMYSDFGYGDFNGSNTSDKAFDGSTSTKAEPHDNDTVYFDFSHVNPTGTLLNYDGNDCLPTYLNQGNLAAGDGLRNNPIYHAFDGSTSTYCDMTYLNGQYSRLTFKNPITNVTNITLGYDGEGDPGYNGGNHVTNVSLNGSRQTVQIYNGSAITLNNLDFISQAGGGVCRLYDVTITTTTQSATKLTLDGGVSVSSSLRMYLNKAGSPSANHFTVNGTSLGGSVTSGDWLTIGSVSKLKNIALYHQSGSSSVELFAVEVDSSVLTDGTPATGVNSFYLPMDGNSPIGQDQSPNGNDFTPVNFGCSNSVNKATGALPILNTVNGGNRATVGVRTDAYSANLTLALPLVGSANDVSNRINSGSTTKTVTNYDSNAVFTSTYSNFYGGSVQTSNANTGSADASAKILQIASNSDFSFTGDFTVETWIYATAIESYGTICGNYATVNDFYIEYSTENGLLVGYNNATYSGSYTAVANVWKHIAVTRSGSTLRTFVDGVQTSSHTASGTIAAQDFGVGGYYVRSRGFEGYIQDFRIYKGVAKYTSNFIPASTNPDILPDTPSGVSGSSKLTKITSGAVSFNGTATTKLRVSDSTDFSFGTNDFCIEYFYYNNSLDGTYNIIFDNIDTNRSGIQLSMFTSNHYSIEVGDGAGNWIWKTTGDYPATQHQWVHFALTRQGSTFRAFENGVLLATATSSTAVGNPRAAAIGGYSADDSTNYGFNGLISNFRIVNGSSVYTAAFTPPTEPLTNITNTKLLCCKSPNLAGDAVVTPNSSLGNISRVWSEQGTAGGTLHGTYNKMQSLFTYGTGTDADERFMSGSTSGDSIFYKPSTNIPYSSSFSLYLRNGDTANSTFSYSLDGGASYTNLTTTSGDGSWVDISGSGTITTVDGIRVKHVTTAGTNAVDWRGIKVDGSILLDPVSRNGDPGSTTLNPFNTDIDTVRGQETGYCTWNPLVGTGTLSDGNLKFDGASDWKNTDGTISFSSGKWYYEGTYVGSQYGSNQGNIVAGIGFKKTTAFLPEGSNAEPVNSADYRNNTIAFYQNGYFTDFGTGTGTHTSIRSQIATGDVVGVSIDLDNGSYEFYVNGTSITSGTVSYNGELVPWAEAYYVNAFVCNFGQKPFKFPPPDGFQPLNGANVRPETVIARPNQYVTLYNGTASTQSITGLGYKPDLVWLRRHDAAGNNNIQDVVRGASLFVQADYNGQQMGPSGARLASFDSDGFTVTSDNGANTSGGEYVAWCWKAGGNKNTFNVDDVGYANASDVNMSVGSLNSSSYNDDQTWSTYGSASGATWNPAVSNLFNNDLSVGPSLLANNTGTWTFTSGITASKSIEIYTVNGSGPLGSQASDTYIRLTVDGTVHSINCVAGWVDTGLTGSLTAITIHVAQSGSPGLRAIRVDGEELVDPSITPTNVPTIPATGCSVGTKQGFSIIKYEANGSNGATVPHGLNQPVDLILFKSLGRNDNWRVYHSAVGHEKCLFLSTNGTPDDNASYFNDTAPTSSVFSLGTDTGVNTDDDDVIAYCWHDVPGLQKFGSFTGNNSTNGAFIELGFRPALVWIKRTGSTGHWFIIDNKRRYTFNPVDEYAFADITNVYDPTNGGPSGGIADFLSNGIKFRENSAGANESDSYIYCAWAEAPAFNLYGAQSNAR